jgi:Ser-tRNA(Ala) deacylase AlaX
MLNTTSRANRQTSPPARTELVFHRDAKRYTLPTTVIAVLPFASLASANKALFKQGQQQEASETKDASAPAYYAVVTEATIFHPQGGGQPSDVGTITAGEGGGASTLNVLSARTDAINAGQVLHFGQFTSGPAGGFAAGTSVTQAIDVNKRILYSRLHTAGHVLGAAVRHLVENEVEGFDELKASHFPDAASCEFRGKIEGHWKDPIQARVAEYISKAMPVEIDWWDAADFRKHGLERLIPQPAAPSSTTAELPTETWRIVRIVGAEVYPCGGTHVDTTDLCGETRVTKISRSKGISRVSYTLADTEKA